MFIKKTGFILTIILFNLNFICCLPNNSSKETRLPEPDPGDLKNSPIPSGSNKTIILTNPTEMPTVLNTDLNPTSAPIATPSASPTSTVTTNPPVFGDGSNYFVNGYQIPNFGIVIPKVFRGSSPLEDEIKFSFLYKIGVTQLIGLDKYSIDNDVLCSKYKIKCSIFPISIIPVPLLSDMFFGWTTFKEAFHFIINILKTSDESVFIHSSSGEDRVGIMSAALRIRASACPIFLDPDKDLLNLYDKNKLLEEIKADLYNYGYSSLSVNFIRNEVKGWVDSPPSWICE